MLIQRAVNDPGWAFDFTKHHYRPLTKYVYFAVMYAVFGLKPFMYHFVSLAVHVASTLLVYRIVLRLAVRPAPAIVTAALFGMNVAFLNAVAWISCIQQLAGGFFFLLCFWAGLRALQDRSGAMQIVSSASYVFAVLSLEQTFAAGALLVAVALLGVAGRRFRVRETLYWLWPHLLIFGVYTIQRALKGVPDSGFAGFAYEKNVLENVVTYLGALTNPWPVVSGLITGDPLAFRWPHAVLIALVVYHLNRRRFGAVVFAIGFLLVTLFPTLFLRGHQFYYHTYVPSLGVMYLFALALNDFFGMAMMSGRRARVVVTSLVVVGVFVGSFSMVRANFKRATDPATWEDASFVIRRATIGKRIHDDLLAKAGDTRATRTVHMIYFVREKGQAGGGERDLFWALGNGAAVALTLGDPSIEVVLDIDPKRLYEEETATSRVFLYDRVGHVYTLADIRLPSQ